MENSIIGPKYNGISSMMDRPVRTSKILTKMNLIYSARGLKLPHSRHIGVKCTLKEDSFFLDFPKNILGTFWKKDEDTNSLVNTDSFYANFTNTTFQKISICHLTQPMKQTFLHFKFPFFCLITCLTQFLANTTFSKNQK